MFGLRAVLLVALCAFSAAAAEQPLDRRQGTANINSVTCGSNRYTRQQIEAATAEGCRLNAARQTVGSSNYPHQFNNRENLVFASSGPFQEFPILSNGQLFTGRNPGADRIVFNPNLNGRCTYVGSMTHTNAPTTNGFVLCSSSLSQPSSTQGNSAAPSSAVVWGSAYAAILSLLVHTGLYLFLW